MRRRGRDFDVYRCALALNCLGRGVFCAMCSLGQPPNACASLQKLCCQVYVYTCACGHRACVRGCDFARCISKVIKVSTFFTTGEAARKQKREGVLTKLQILADSGLGETF